MRPQRTAISSLLLVTVLATAGCAASSGAEGSSSSAPTDVASAAGSATPEAAPSYGDVVASGTIIDTPLGSYEQTAVAPDSEALVYDPAVSAERGLGSFTEADAASATKFLGTFVLSEGHDSFTANSTDPQDVVRWIDQHAEMLHPDFIEDMKLPSGGSDRSGIVSSNQNNMEPPFIHDGGLRVHDAHLTWKKLVTYEEGGREYLEASGIVITDYRVTDADAIAALIESGGTEEQVKDIHAYLYDAEPDNSVFSLQYSWTYWLAKVGEDWVIGGYATTVSPNGLGITDTAQG